MDVEIDFDRITIQELKEIEEILNTSFPSEC